MTWKDDLNYGLAAFGLKIPESLPIDAWASKLTHQPARNNAAIVLASSIVFYIAERDHNPKVNEFYDALIYCSTCLSVGYGDIFAKTPIGKLIGTTLMTYGPALTGAALDGPRDPKADAAQQKILETLSSILQRLPEKTATAS